MGLPTWGMLDKSQIDPEKIEEAINRIVKSHNENPEAHLLPGQSLQSHKASEIIDHRASSIIADKVKPFEILPDKLFLKDYSFSCFESLDGWQTKHVTGSAVITARLNNLYLRTGNTINSRAQVFNNELSIGGLIPYKNSIFETVFKVGLFSLTNVRMIVGVGDPGLEFGEDDGTADAYGFMVVNGVLQAFSCTTDGINKKETIVNIIGVPLTITNHYRAVYTADSKVEYFVNGILRATIMTNIPKDGGSSTFVLGIRNTAASNREFYIRYVLFSQDL